MAKYLLFVLLTVVCCSFNICEKKVFLNGVVNRIYIYPDCNDTSCYLKQRYQANHIVEYLYLNSKLKLKRILDKNGSWIVNEYLYSKEKGEVHRNDTFAGTIPDISFEINDTCSLNIEYFADGSYHICTYGYNRSLECQHAGTYASTIVFDSIYKSKMVGQLQIICDTNSVTDAFTNEEMVKIVHRERQTGMWHTYRLDNMKIDSTFYDPRKSAD